VSPVDASAPARPAAVPAAPLAVEVTMRSRRFGLALKPAFGIVVGTALGLGTLVPGQIAPASPTDQQLAERLRPPAWMDGGTTSHLLGTDSLGRDVCSRVIYGARTTFVVALVSSLLGGIGGTGLGLLAGYHGGMLDELVRKLIDMQLAFPYLLLAISVMAVAGRSLPILVVVLALSSWPAFARIVRGEVLSLRERQFIEGARAIGCDDRRILLAHVLPGVTASLCVVWSFDLARVVVLESSLSFLGLGVQPPTPSWGMDLSESRQFLQIAYWTVLFPGLAISLVVLAANLVGDWVRDVLDPIVKRSRASA
jgi:ABC-type dipeptide/oligopeptide/nickel transport system permease subunit